MTLLTVISVLLFLAASAPLLRRKPRIVLAGYTILGVFVPYWVGIQIGPQFVPLILGLSLAALLLTFRSTIKLNVVDGMVLVLGVSSVLMAVVGLAVQAHALALVGAWLLPYFFGRLVAEAVSPEYVISLFGGVAIILAVQSLAEFALDWHPFTSLVLEGGPSEIWNRIQYRSVFPRSEGAVGHSIVMGALISLGVPFVMSFKKSPLFKWSVLTIMALGVLVTFSRSALISFVFAIVLSAIYIRARNTGPQRGALAVVSAVITAIIAPIYLAAIDRGTGVLESSTEYRANYLSVIPDVNWVGISDIYTQYDYGRFGWISEDYPGSLIVTLDNTVLLNALQFGWINTALLVSIFGLLGIYLLRGGVDNAALVSVVSQFFTVATVAMITQFPYIYWLLIGIAVSWFRSSLDRELSSQTNLVDGRLE